MAMILTPTGYRDIASCVVGDDVSAFDITTGAPVVNQIETLQWIDAAEWARWWEIEETVPPFRFIRINGQWTLNSEQSIWRNGDNVCHARDLVVGDIVYDDADRPVTISSLEEVTADGWWRFDISGDHSYIVDGLTLHNASRFWVGGTGTWDASTTTPWASSSGGAGGNSVPGSADTVTLDGNSGGGTVTVNFGGTVTITSLTMGAFTGTFDNSVNNNNFTFSGSASTPFNCSGTATRTVKFGSATYTVGVPAGGATWNISTATNLTLQASSSTITWTGTGSRSFFGGNKTYGTINLPSITGSPVGAYYFFNDNLTVGTLNITAPNYVQFSTPATVTITNPFSWVGTASNPIGLDSTSSSGPANIVASGGGSIQYASLRDLAFTTGTVTATNSFNLGNNSGITITGPSGGGGTKFSAAFVG